MLAGIMFILHELFFNPDKTFSQRKSDELIHLIKIIDRITLENDKFSFFFIL